MKCNTLQTGDKVGMCTFIEYIPRRNKCYWGSMRCFCGKVFDAEIRNVANPKRQQGCGCRKSPKGTNSKQYKHGNSTRSITTREYTAWKAMKRRCADNPSKREYKHYFGRGIRVCDRWATSFENFLVDVGEKPIGKYSLDRIDNNGNYEPGNVRWATIEQQARNRSNNTWLTLNGNRHTIVDWANILGVEKKILSKRFMFGWTDKDVLTAPIRTRTENRPDKHICLNIPRQPLVVSGSKYKLQ